MNRLPTRLRPRLRLLGLAPALLLVLATLAATFAAPAQAGPAPAHTHDEGPQLSATFFGSSSEIAPGATATLALEVHNGGADASNLLVSIVTARLLRYVPGSASPGASFDSARTVAWAGVSLAAGATRTFAIQVRAEDALSPTAATSAATVLGGDGVLLVRSATILVRPEGSGEPEETPNLRASLLLPSRAVVRSGDTVSYTLLLVNTGDATALVTASVVISEPLSYVPGSAGEGGSYDAATRALTWQGVEVPSGEARRLRFAALAGSVTERTPTVLRADISAGEQRLQRRAALLIVPGRDDGNGGRPVVTGFVAGSSDVTSEPTVTLHISATDDVSVTRMYVREWQLSTRPLPHWEPVRSSGWVPFQSALPWTLGSANGVHVLGVWVQDAAGHVSALTDASTDVINLVRPDATVARGGLVPYLVRYEAGAQVQLSLATTSGDADLYVWYPRSFRLPDEVSANEGTAPDGVSFTAPLPGYYLIGVYGSESSSYTLSIAPGGGPQLASGASLAALPAIKQQTSLISPLAAAGTSPLGSDSASDPAAGATLYLPLVTK
jgi:uncharacterized repeat protein (TIGR01451 family)